LRIRSIMKPVIISGSSFFRTKPLFFCLLEELGQSLHVFRECAGIGLLSNNHRHDFPVLDVGINHRLEDHFHSRLKIFFGSEISLMSPWHIPRVRKQGACITAPDLGGVG
jgi:hypothetical protein